MKYLETIFRFLTTLVRIIFPRKQKPADSTCPCPDPFPAPASPPLPPDARDGSDIDLHRGDSVAICQGDWGTKQRVEPVEVAGVCLMAGGVIGEFV